MDLLLAKRILEIDYRLSESELKSIYRKKVIALHPDTNKSSTAAEEFRALNSAYQFLLKHLNALQPKPKDKPNYPIIYRTLDKNKENSIVIPKGALQKGDKMYINGLSFIIPAWNEEKNIDRCIQSIHSEMKHHADLPYEVLVIDNNSTDRTPEIAVNAYAKVIFEWKKGVVFARQRGAANAKYRYLANIDADNYLPNGWVSVARKHMFESAAISGPLVYENVPKYFNVGSNVFYFFARIFHVLIAPTIQGGNYILDKIVWEEMGGYDTSFEFYGEDTNTARMAKNFGKIKLVPDLWIYSSPRRIEGQGLLKTMYLYIVSYLSVGLFGKTTTNDYKDFR